MRNPREYLEMKAIYVFDSDRRTSLLLENIYWTIKIINYFELHVRFDLLLTLEMFCIFLEEHFSNKLDKIYCT